MNMTVNKQTGEHTISAHVSNGNTSTKHMLGQEHNFGLVKGGLNFYKEQGLKKIKFTSFVLK